MANTDLTAQRLRELLSYDATTGRFTWLVSRPGTFAGSVAGHLDSRSSSGYRTICINWKTHREHRLAWLYMTGEWPVSLIDHINGVRDDNRWCNLREANKSQNGQNRYKARSDSASPLIGASWISAKGKWCATIKVNGKQKFIGLFATDIEAHRAYVQAKDRLHPYSMLTDQGVIGFDAS